MFNSAKTEKQPSAVLVSKTSVRFISSLEEDKTKRDRVKFEEKFKFKFQLSFIIVDRYLSFNFHLLK